MPYSVGDIVLTGIKSQGAISYLIKFGALVAGYPKDARRFAHCAVITDENGMIAEARAEGIQPGHISRFPDGDTVIIPMGVDAHDAAQVKAFASQMILESWGYGFGTFAAAGFNCLAAGLRLGGHGIYFGVGHSRICSVFVAEALTRAGVYWDVDPSAIMPCDIWTQFGHKAQTLATYRKRTNRVHRNRLSASDHPADHSLRLDR